MSLSWTKFREKHLFSVNLAVVAGLILWQARKDFTFHPVIILWCATGFFVPALRRIEKKLMLAVGKVNGFILLSVFYFLAFTPFALCYRWFFRHKSFVKSDSTFVTKTSLSDFQRPF